MRDDCTNQSKDSTLALTLKGYSPEFSLRNSAEITKLQSNFNVKVKLNSINRRISRVYAPKNSRGNMDIFTDLY